MTSEPIRDPLADRLLTPQNCALVIIDYQPTQIRSWQSPRSVDAMREGYETYPVTDAVGGTSAEADQAGLDRIAQGGGQPTSVTQVGCELQRDWARGETAEGFGQILFGGERALAGAAR
jgi:nicotinamidase-related amidase